MLTGSPTEPFAVFGDCTGLLLSRVPDPARFPGDPLGSIRTVQFGATPGQSGSARPSMLTFQVLTAGDGSFEIDVVLLLGDQFARSAGAEILPPDSAIVEMVA